MANNIVTNLPNPDLRGFNYGQGDLNWHLVSAWYRFADKRKSQKHENEHHYSYSACSMHATM